MTVRIPSGALAVLAPRRADANVRVRLDGDFAWVFGETELLRPVRGAVFFEQRDGVWYEAGKRIPSEITPPAGEDHAVWSLVAPAKFTPTPPVEPLLDPSVLTLQACHVPRTATLLECTVTALKTWADSALTKEVEALQAARHADSVLLRGSVLSSIRGSRYWGTTTVFQPMGLALPIADTTIASLLKLDAEIAVIQPHGIRIVPLAAFHPLTRGGVARA